MAPALVVAAALLASTQAVRIRLRKDAEVGAEDVPTEFLPWEQAIAKAKNTSKEMDMAEIVSLLHGIKPNERNWYHRQTQAVHRLGVPALKMQDASGGYHTNFFGTAGTTVMWPCGLALAATWDQKLVHDVGSAMGEEFHNKGANVMLGPALNVHRLQGGGRTWEYMPGEDPVLGAKLVKPFIRGVQGQGVMCVVKHFAFNQMEKNNGGDVHVDPKTAWELYYPPFEAAIDAGAVGAMCAKNQVNGSYACENFDLLRRDLKGKMDFKGFVMSDTGAIHSPYSIGAGVDQDMPGGWDNLWEPNLLNMSMLRSATDEAVNRVLAAIYRMRLDETPGCDPPGCAKKEMSSKARSGRAEDTALVAARASIVLLKNDERFLPMNGTKKIKRLVVLGRAANAEASVTDYVGDLYSGGGSGHVLPKKCPTVLQALKERAPKHGLEVMTYPGADPNDEMLWEVVSLADVVIVVAGAEAGEGHDREDLSLDKGADGLIRAVAKIKPTGVLMMTPGAVATPWRDEVRAIVNIFYGGEHTAQALTDVLFGDVNPEGKLPVMMPDATQDKLSVGTKRKLDFSETLFTSYRDPKAKIAFPFGHGLSYTTFNYGPPYRVTENCDGTLCFKVPVTNTGSRVGREVIQAYVKFPPAANEPEIVLRNFVKTTPLSPGESEDMLISFSERDLSYYNNGLGWIEQAHDITIFFSSSSKDHRQKVYIE